MIDSVTGTLIYICESHVIVDVNGFGIRVYTTTIAISLLKDKLGETVSFLTKIILRDSGIEIFGFNSKEDLNLFLKLNMVSGVGPRTAINMIDRLGTKNIIAAISSQNSLFISSAPGIGTKTAKKILLELERHFLESKEEIEIQIQQAIKAIANMGHSKSESIEMVRNGRQNLGDKYTTQDLIREALKALI